MSPHVFTHSSARLKRVKKLQFGVLSPDEIRQMSVTQKVTVNNKVIPPGITRYETYSNGLPLYGGVNDPRMGTFDQRAKCKTCDCAYTGGSNGNKINDCPGHFGHIELARPVFHVGFLDTALKVLRCVCFHCSRLRIDARDFKYRLAKQISDPKKRLAYLHDVCRNKQFCVFGLENIREGLSEETSENLAGGGGEDASGGGCGGPQPKFSKLGLRVEVEFPAGFSDEELPGGGDRKQTLSASKVHDIFKGISDEDMVLLGLDPRYSRPDWLIITVLPVPPPHVRPSVALDGGMNRSEDDLTHQLVNIVKANNTLDNCVRSGEPHLIIENFEQLLQYKISALFDNEQAGQPQETQRSGKPLKTLRQRLKGKEGRIRGNLMGKRVDFSARTVITADPNLGIDQVGVPRSIALNLTFPETVTAFNHDHLAALVARGPLEHPGAKFIIRHDGVRVDLRYVRNKNDLILEYGWVVERHLTDDDVIVFNRQPSLHKMSIMGHRVKVLDWSTFRLNLSVTSPYNADFDGDEMNLHVPQSVTAKAEVQELMMVPRNIVSPQSNKPVMGIVQDTLMAVAKMTRRDAFIPRDLMMNILMWVDDWDGRMPAPAIYKPVPLWTGKQLFSVICPKVNFDTTANGHPKGPNVLNASDTSVLIQDGELLMGIVDKKTVGSSPQGLIHISWLERGWDVTRAFMGVIQKVVNNWLLAHSFSIGVADTVADADTIRTIEGIIESAKTQVGSLVAQGQKGELKTQPGKSMMESLEANINTVLNKCRDDSGTSAQQSLSERNAVKHMATCGSKGSFINISQILACVGQQNVEGQRIPYGFRRRTLPHFAKDDLGPESRGFVENSYLRGLSPQEFFFHAMGGREGLIDTAVKTAETGYIQRRLVKALEAVSAKYDGTLRDQNNKVVQFLYGEDGMDGVWVERQALHILTLSRADLARTYHIDVNSDAFGTDPGRPGQRYLTRGTIDACRNDDALRAELEGEFERLQEDQRLLVNIFAAKGQQEASSTGTNLPVNIRRLIWNAQKLFKVDTGMPTDLAPGYVVETVRDLCGRLLVVGGQDRLSLEAQHNATLLFHILVRSELAAKPVLRLHRLDKSAFDWVVGEVESKFMSAKVAAGEMCGVLAAQSIGEPITQMTLNTFHYAGVSAKNVTLGVPRVKEIINVASHVKTPSLTIYLAEGEEQSQETAKKVVDLLEYVTLGNITHSTQIFYDPSIQDTVVEADREFVNDMDVDELEGEGGNLSKLSPWVLRFVLRNALVLDKDIRLREDIAQQITRTWGESEVHVQYSEQNAEEKVIRIRMVDDDADKAAGGDGGGGSGELMKTDDVQFLKKFEKNLLSMRLLGIEKISKVYMSEGARPVFTEAEGFRAVNEWHLETDGSDFRTVLSYPTIDHRRTMSNDVVECLQVLGIEGARGSLLREFRAVVEKDGSYVNYRHLGTLVDVMTFRGFLMAITRHGINRVDNGPMLRSSFEETVEILMEAAVFAEADNLRGVTDNIMLGQLANLGTGCHDLLLDEKRLMQAIEYGALDSAMARLGAGKEGGAARAGGAGGTGDLGSRTPAMTPHYGTPGYTPGMSPMGGGMTPFGAAAFSPMASPFSGVFSPGGRSPLSPAGMAAAASSPAYSPQSAGFSPHSPGYSPSSPAFSPSSPAFSPTSPAFSPSSPAYSPTSPAYSPSSPAGGYNYSPSSPSYSPSSPAYSPSSPAMPTAGRYGQSASSPAYSPTSPAYSPTSPSYNPTGGGGGAGGRSPAYSPTSPAFSPSSPAYSPSSPAYSPSSPGFSPKSPAAAAAGRGAALGGNVGAYGAATSPAYSPTSPAYSASPMDMSPHGQRSSPSNFSPEAPSYTPSENGQQPPAHFPPS